METAGNRVRLDADTIDRTVDALLTLLTERVEQRMQAVLHPEVIVPSPAPAASPQRVSEARHTLIVLDHLTDWQAPLVTG